MKRLICNKNLFILDIREFRHSCKVRLNSIVFRTRPTAEQNRGQVTRSAHMYKRQTNGVGVAARSRALARVIQPFSRSSIMQFKVKRVQQFSCTRVISFGQSISLLQAAGPGPRLFRFFTQLRDAFTRTFYFVVEAAGRVSPARKQKRAHERVPPSS